MTYVVNESCIRCKTMDCVEVCPVDCFYEGENMLVIHPDECIDCGVCEPECPVDAIKPDTEAGLERWLGINAEYARVWPNITVKREPPSDAKDWRTSLTRPTCYRQTLAQVIDAGILEFYKREAGRRQPCECNTIGIFAWAMREGWADANPTLGTNTFAEKSRDRVLAIASCA